MEQNKRSQCGGRRRGQEEINQRSCIHICITLGRNSVRKPWGAKGVEWRGAKRGIVEDICNTDNNQKE